MRKENTCEHWNGYRKKWGFNMPFKDPKYKHIRRRPPKTIDPNSYYTVPISHTKAKKRYPKGTLARIGTALKTGNVVIQAILIPLKKGG